MQLDKKLLWQPKIEEIVAQSQNEIAASKNDTIMTIQKEEIRKKFRRR